MHDLRVTWIDVYAAAFALEAATQEAASLPRSRIVIFEELDMRGSDVSEATAELLRDWAEGLDAIEEAGRGLHAWLLEAVDVLRALDAELAGG